MAITLSLGLWPFHPPKNDVSWLGGRPGIVLGSYGSAFAVRPLPAAAAGRDLEITVEAWLQPRRIWDSGSFLTLYNSARQTQFSLRQVQKDLRLEAINRPQERSSAETFTIEDVFQEFSRGNAKPVFLAVTSGAGQTNVYADGVLRATRAGFHWTPLAIGEQLILGDSPRQPDSWPGKIFGLAIYNQQIDRPLVALDWFSWKQAGHPQAIPRQSAAALYTFDERSGNLIHDIGISGVNLSIPASYHVFDKLAFQPFWTEFEMSRSYWQAVLKNVIGFIPFGFCFYPLLLTLRPKRAQLTTVALGTTVSLLIEFLQIFLPTRDSGTTDLFTNTLGTWIGVVASRATMPVLARFFPLLRSSANRPGGVSPEENRSC